MYIHLPLLQWSRYSACKQDTCSSAYTTAPNTRYETYDDTWYCKCNRLPQVRTCRWDTSDRQCHRLLQVNPPRWVFRSTWPPESPSVFFAPFSIFAPSHGTPLRSTHSRSPTQLGKERFHLDFRVRPKKVIDRVDLGKHRGIDHMVSHLRSTGSEGTTSSIFMLSSWVRKLKW